MINWFLVSKYATTLPPVCLEANKKYKTKIHFQRFDKTQLDPSASILVDSVSILEELKKIYIKYM